MREPFLRDPDVTLYHGDVLEVLRELPAESVDCCITSPPYWGLRDYGTGAWDGGDKDCDHKRRAPTDARDNGGTFRNSKRYIHESETMPDVCGKCGARRIDNQLGLEPTPDQYITRMVEVSREVRRVLRAHGTCWVNMGDGYASGTGRGYPRDYMDGGAVTAPEVMNDTPRFDPRAIGLKHKDLIGMPWRLAFALQADGWYLRSDIIWSKPNPMPESVTDRPTKAHEYVFLLSKAPRYFFDQEAVREPAEWARWGDQTTPKYQGSDTATGWMRPKTKAELAEVAGGRRRDGNSRDLPGSSFNNNPNLRGNVGRNVRSVWEIATQPYPDAHFATFPEELVRRCVLAGCPEWTCSVCGKPRERIMERGELIGVDRGGNYKGREVDPMVRVNPGTPGMAYEQKTLGWSDCGCIRSTGSNRSTGPNRFQPGVVLDPFIGSGTTALVARKHGRHTIGIELSESYCQLAAKRLQQLSLLAEAQ